MAKILVTGGAGYIGRAAMCALDADGHEVYGYDPNIAAAGFADPRRFVPGPAWPASEFDLVVHLAAFCDAAESVRLPTAYWSNNVGSLCDILASGAKRVVFASSCAVYGSSPNACSEDALLSPLSPYGRSKVACEQILQDSGVPYIALRLFNVVGATDKGIGFAGRILPRLARAALGGETVTLAQSLTGGTPIRDYVHVRDVASAIVAATRLLLAADRQEAVNIGSGIPTTLLDLAASTQVPINNLAFVPAGAHDPASCWADISKARILLGWKPTIPLDDAIREVAEYMRGEIAHAS